VSTDLLELAADALGELLDDVVFLGGATIGLWVTDPAAPPARVTNDVDVVVEVATRLAFYEFEDRLRAARFNEDVESGVVCRWRHRDSDLVLDAMPQEPSILGFENRWQGPAASHASKRALPSGARIRAAAPAYLLATKIEAFHGRGKEDFIASRDFEDIITLIDGRAEIVDEVRQCEPALRSYLTEELQTLTAHPRFRDGVAAALPGDAASQARADLSVMPRIRELCRDDRSE
jgi:hypothetical protein